jgi:hypothetical protein
MRAILVSAILLLGLAGAAPEPEYFAFGGTARASRNSASELVEIESATRRGDRLRLPLQQPRVLQVEILRSDEFHSPLKLAPPSPDLDDPASAEIQATPGPKEATPASLDDLCNTLFASAQDNDLPVPFFANLLWQESRLRDDVVSKKGALGIAQFMPKVAVETGLANPFDPMQAIPASARFLQRLRLQFGNLGFVAAAYNAGAHRVIEWLEHRASLPRETRGYVVQVTGLSVEAWRKMPIDNDTLTFAPHLPCRNLPAFANVEQERVQQAEMTRAKQVEAMADEPIDAAPPAEKTARSPAKEAHESKHETLHRNPRRVAHEDHGSKHESPHDTKEAHAAKHEAAKHEAAKHEVAKYEVAKHEAAKHQAAKHEAAKHEAAHSTHSTREKHRSA